MTEKKLFRTFKEVLTKYFTFLIKTNIYQLSAIGFQLHEKIKETFGDEVKKNYKDGNSNAISIAMDILNLQVSE